MSDEELTQAMTDAVIFGTGVMQDGKRIDPLSFFVQPVSDPACEHCGMDPAAMTEQLEQLVASNEYLNSRLENVLAREAETYAEHKEQLEAARADAKEAEAYAEELAKDQVDLCRQLIAAEAKLAKAVEALRMADTALYEAEAILGGEYGDFYGPLCEHISKLRATLAEIEGEKT